MDLSSGLNDSFNHLENHYDSARVFNNRAIGTTSTKATPEKLKI